MKNVLLVCVVALLAIFSFGQSNPVPLINNPLVPDTAAPGGQTFTLTVNGTGFVSNSVVNWNNTPLATNFVSSSQLTATVPAANIAAVGTASVTVVNQAPAGASNVQFFDVRSPFSSSSFGLSSFGTVGSGWIVTEDVNGDGKLDLITTGSGGAYTYLGNGDGTFQPATVYPTGGNTGIFIASDFNGDGNVDLAVAGSGSISILIGNGDGTFQPYQYAPGSPEGPSLVAGDFNGDGAQDLATNTYTATGSTVGILLGNGDGTFQSPISYPVSSNQGSNITTGDFNGDGILDLAISVQDDFAVAVLLGNGDGSFQGPVEFNVGFFSGDVIAADLNNDGNLDLAIYSLDTAGRTESEISVLLGNGDATFQPPAHYPLGGSALGPIIAGDLNGDGYLDLVATTYPGGNTNAPTNLAITYLGRGDGTFQNEGYFATGAVSGGVALGDFNGDGMLDIAAATGGNNAGSVLLQATSVLSQTTIAFPRTKVGRSSMAGVTLSNIGSSSFTVGKFVFKGKNTSAFSQTNNCGTGLQAGATCTITIVFKPTTAGRFTNIKLAIGDSAVSVKQTIYITGIAIAR